MLLAMMRRRKLNVRGVELGIYSHWIMIIHDDFGRQQLPCCSSMTAPGLEAVTRPPTTDMPFEHDTCCSRKDIRNYSA